MRPDRISSAPARRGRQARRRAALQWTGAWVSWDDLLWLRFRFRFNSSDPRQRHADRAGDAAGQQVDEGDQEQAEDGPRGRLRDRVGDVRHELDEQGAVDGTGDRGEPADHDADEESDRDENVEAVGRDELDGDRTERAGDA